MQVKVLYFAAVRDLAGIDEEEISLPEAVQRVDQLASWLSSHRPALAGRLGSVRFARNEVFARADEVLADGDVVAVIPPVAGG